MSCHEKYTTDPVNAGETRVAEREALRSSSFGPRSRWAKNVKDLGMYQNLKKL